MKCTFHYAAASPLAACTPMHIVHIVTLRAQWEYIGL